MKSLLLDYNAMFKTNYGVDSKSFQNYYRDLAGRVINQEVDLLVVVGMFLTGFDATKTFGHIVTFRDLEKATIDAITLFGDRNTKNVVLEKSYKEYLEGFTDIATGKARRGYLEVVKELQQRFPNPDEIVKESDKKDFAKLFGEYLRVENILQNYDECASLKALQDLDVTDADAVETFKDEHYLNDDDLAAMQAIRVPAERTVQDYRSTYNDYVIGYVVKKQLTSKESLRLIGTTWFSR